MVAFVIGETGQGLKSVSEGFEAAGAAALGAEQRMGLSVRVLARAESVSRLAERHGVSRKFLYAQAGKASEALAEAFAPPAEGEKVLFHLPVTERWLEQLVLGLVLVCHSPLRGVQELLRDLFDYRLSLGSVFGIVRRAVERARQVNAREDLSGIRVGAHDEIYQAGSPVLVGADVRSTYCYLLAAEASCDETTWGVRLLELAARGLALERTIADGGRGLRAGQAAALPGVPCDGDVFHAEMDLGALACYLENRARGCASARQKLERRMERAKRTRGGQALSARLASAREAAESAAELARDIRTLSDWMQRDILSMAGPDFRSRIRLFDFVVEELRSREKLCPHRIKPVRRKLQNGRDELLAFARLLDEQLAEIAARFQAPSELVRAVCELQGSDPKRPEHWQRRAELHRLFPGRFHQVEAAVIEAMREIARASSIVENLNSRLRSYFFLRRHLGDGYLDLLRFFLNHHRFLRSAKPERVGKSPAELLSGHPHAHWLELLGYRLFKRTAA